MADETTVQPWDRQPGESSKAYEAFCVYRDLGANRSLQRVASELSKSAALMKRWASQWGWVSRAEDWDSIPARATAEAYQDMARRVAEQHDRVANKLLARLEQNLDMMPTGADPSMRWSTAHNAARQGHAFAADLTKPESTRGEEITAAIENLLNKLAGE